MSLTAYNVKPNKLWTRYTKSIAALQVNGSLDMVLKIRALKIK